jgi:hypothetical protein
MNINVTPVSMYKVSCKIINAGHCSELKELLESDPEFLLVNTPDKITISFLCHNKNYCTDVIKKFEKRKVEEVLADLRLKKGSKVPKPPQES